MVAVRVICPPAELRTVELEVTVAVCAPARASQHMEANTKKRIFFMKRQLEYSNRERAFGKFVL